MEFHEKIEEWKVLLKKNREAADRHYYDNLFPGVIERFLSRSENLKKYRYLISLLGFSPQPIILFLKAITPEKVLFIHSEETEQHLDTIQKWTGLTLSKIEKKSVDSSNPTDVYRAIKDFVLPRNGKEILLDITGGKKSMVGGAAMAGNLLGIDVGYVDYDEYLDELRQPKPGSEYPNILKNPLEIIGDIDLEKAKEAFNRCDFARCIDILSMLEQRVEDIWGIRKLLAIAKIYHEIESFHFTGAAELIEDFLNKWKNDGRFVPAETVQKTSQVLKILTDQNHPEYQLYSCLNYFFAGERFAERKRFDVAIFLIYRTVEMVLSFGLNGAGIDSSKPVYPPWINGEIYNKKLREVFERDYYEKNLPSKIGLMDSAILLSIKGDPLVGELSLKELKGVITLRNESHFTHGSRILTNEDFERIRRVARKLLEKNLSLKRKPLVKDFIPLFSFPKI